MGEELDDGPAVLFMPLVVMENLLDKLKLLKYDLDFVGRSRKALNRHYFALQTNPGEQFYMFCLLASFLIRKCGKDFDEPQESDDPNSIISNILDISRQMGIVVDFPPNRLKQGYGEQVIYILDRLADEALKVSSFTWKKPEYPVEEDEIIHVVDTESELMIAKIEEDLTDYNNDIDDEDDEHLIGIDDLRTLNSAHKTETGSRHVDILETVTDNSEWKMELERVLPKLRLSFQEDSKDWRNHLEQMRLHFDEIDQIFSPTKTQLEKLSSDVSRSIDKISSREKYLNSQLESQLNNYRTIMEQLETLNEQYHRVNGGIIDRSRKLTEISEELENVKQEIEERSSAMTDGSPLINIKKALSRLKSELTSVDIRIAVVEHSLLQAKLREKTTTQQEISASLSLASNSFVDSKTSVQLYF
ncbi:Intraflagellar transport protein 57 [Chamberlinius hualienensis]